MSDQSFLAGAFDTFYNVASAFFHEVTEFVAGTPESLRDGTEFDPVKLPRDLAAHDNAQTEWWYYTGHAKTDAGRRFGFELVFFKRRTDLDNFSVVPLRLIGNPFYFAHFAITDHERSQFRYSHRKSANGALDYPAFASDRHYYLGIGDWTVREAQDSHVVRAAIDTDIVFEATLSPAKTAVFNGRGGVSYKDDGQASRYFSYTRMNMEGDLLRNGKIEHFSGNAWMDREFGTWTPTDNQKGWDWFSVQFDNGCELMCYRLRNGNGETSPYSSGTFVDIEGNATALRSEDFTIEQTAEWESPHSHAVYPSGWNITVSGLSLEMTVTPVMKDQELDTLGTTMIVYWEGSCDVQARIDGDEVIGQAYVELVGYDRSHDKPNLARFLMGNSYDYLANMILK